MHTPTGDVLTSEGMMHSERCFDAEQIQIRTGKGEIQGSLRCAAR